MTRNIDTDNRPLDEVERLRAAQVEAREKKIRELIGLLRSLSWAWAEIHEWTEHLPACLALLEADPDSDCTCGLKKCQDAGHDAYEAYAALRNHEPEPKERP